MGRNIYLGLGILWTLFILYACLIESSSVPSASFLNIPYKDKIAHFTFYCIFSILWFLHYRKRKVISSNKTLSFCIFTIATLMGGTVELMQLFFTDSRGAEWGDFIVNSLGSFVGLLICLTTKRNRKI
ncbi:MAG: VanZ family protein [Flavobacteriaceae bacterium]|nr:VanZ family protein [Flavobacteriaceae bacterium]